MATVVVADDDTEVRGLLALAARLGGHTVVETGDGTAAWQAVRRHHPDLVVSDVDVRGLPGLQLCRAIRSVPETAHVAVILVGAAADAGEAAAAAGASAVVAKPFRVRDLSSLIEASLPAARPADGSAGGGAPEGAVQRPHVLFVDNEPSVLWALRRLLRPLQHTWDLSYVVGGANALDELQAHPCDVIVADYRMPGLDGAELLAAVREAHPRTARLLLSGDPDAARLVTGTLLADRLLAKPSSYEQLVGAIETMVGR